MNTLGMAPIGENDIVALVSLKQGKPFLEALEWVGGTLCSKIEALHRQKPLLRIASIDPTALLIHSLPLPSLAPWQVHHIARYQMKNHWPSLSDKWKTTYFTEKKGKETLLWIMAATKLPFSKMAVDHFISPLFALLSFVSFYFEKEKELLMIHFYEKNALMLLIVNQKIEKELLFDLEEGKLPSLLWRGIKILAGPHRKETEPLPLLLTGMAPRLDAFFWDELSTKFSFPFSFLKTEDPFLMKGALAIGNAFYGIGKKAPFVHFSEWKLSLPTICFLERSKKRFFTLMLTALAFSMVAILTKVKMAHHQLRQQIHTLIDSELPLHPALKKRITQDLEKSDGLERATKELRLITKALASLEKNRPSLNKNGPLWQKIKTLLERVNLITPTILCEYQLDGNDLSLTWTAHEGITLFYDEFCKSSLCAHGEKPTLEVDGTKATLCYTLHPSKKGF